MRVQITRSPAPNAGDDTESIVDADEDPDDDAYLAIDPAGTCFLLPHHTSRTDGCSS